MANIQRYSHIFIWLLAVVLTTAFSSMYFSVMLSHAQGVAGIMNTCLPVEDHSNEGQRCGYRCHNENATGQTVSDTVLHLVGLR